MSKTEELKEIGRFTLVRSSVITEMVNRGVKERFVSTHIARDLGIANASCNSVFTTLRDAGWIVRTATPGTAKEYKWATGGIGVARAWLKSYADSRSGK